MKIVLDNFNYKGQHFKHYVCEMPNVKNLDDVPEEKITEYVIECLNRFIEEEEPNTLSFFLLKI